MRTLRTIVEVRAALVGARQAERRIALVPTMGAFHDGHLSLMRAARSEADVVVVSLFVNPSQFLPGEDFSRYPRTEGDDAERASDAGVDFVFAPSVEEMYPPGSPRPCIPARWRRCCGAAPGRATSRASRPWSRGCSASSRPTSRTSA